MAIYYIDKNRGNDANDGLSTAAPWKELTKMDDAAKAAGDMVLLANDSVWEYGLNTRVVPPTSWGGTQFDPVTIGKYSPLSAGTGKPTIRWNNKIAANEWTYSAPNNCWQYTAPATLGVLILIRLGGTWAASRIDGTQLPLASIDGRFSTSGTTLYLYAPAGTDPTTYYGEVLVSGNTQGFFTVSSGRGCVGIQDIRFEDTGCGISSYSGTAFDVRVNLRRIEGERVSALMVSSSDSPGQLFYTISDCDITDFGACAILTYGAAGTKLIRIFNNRISDGIHTFAQGALYLQARDAALRSHVYGNRISKCRWGTLDKTSDGCAIYTEVGSSVIDIYQNVISDCGCAFQDNSGRTSRWFSNLVYDCKTAMRCTDSSDIDGTDHSFFNNTCIVGADKSNLALFSAQPTETGWLGYRPAGTITSLIVKNNVIVNIGDLRSAAINTPTVTPAASDYTYNSVSGLYTNVAQRYQTPFTVETSTGSITTDPLLTADYKPTPSSPLLGAGTYLGYTRDIERKQRPNPPSIGAYDVATMRTP